MYNFLKNRIYYFDANYFVGSSNFLVVPRRKRSGDHFLLFLFVLTLMMTLTMRSWRMKKTLKTQPWRRWRLGSCSGHGRPIGKFVVVSRGSCLLNSARPAGVGLHQTHAGLAASFIQVDVVVVVGLTASAVIASEFAVISANACAVTTIRSPPFLTST